MAQKTRAVRGGKRPVLGGLALVGLLLAASVASASLYVSEDSGGALHTVQNVFGMAMAPVQLVGVGVAYAEEAAGDAIADATASEESYSALQQENAELKAKVAELEEYKAEAERLQALLDLSDQYSIEGATGRVIGQSSDAWNRVVTLNVGSAAGVQAGLPVMGGTGLVGQVIEVSPLTCRVRLLADPQSGVSVLLQDSRDEGVVRGSVEGLLYLEELDSSAVVEVGDVVVTSGLGGSYFRGMALGTVVNVVSAAGTSDRTVVVSPYSSADPLEELTVVLSMGSEGGLESDADDSSDASEGGE